MICKYHSSIATGEIIWTDPSLRYMIACYWNFVQPRNGNRVLSSPSPSAVVWLTVGAPPQILQPASSTPRGSQFPQYAVPFKASPVFDDVFSSFPLSPLRLPPCTVPCKIVLASADDLVTCPYLFSLRLYTEVRMSSYGPMAFPVLVFTFFLVPYF